MRMACSLARFAINSPWLCMSTFTASSLKLFLINCPFLLFPFSHGSHSGCNHFHHRQNSITRWHFVRLVTSPCGSKWQRHFRIRVCSETSSEIILPGTCACISLGFAQLSPCTSKQINVHFRQEVEVIFWLGVIWQTYAVRKGWKRQVSDESNSCFLQCISNRHWSNRILIKQKRKGMPNARTHRQTTGHRTACTCFVLKTGQLRRPFFQSPVWCVWAISTWAVSSAPS